MATDLSMQNCKSFLTGFVLLGPHWCLLAILYDSFLMKDTFVLSSSITTDSDIILSPKLIMGRPDQYLTRWSPAAVGSSSLVIQYVALFTVFKSVQTWCPDNGIMCCCKCWIRCKIKNMSICGYQRPHVTIHKNRSIVPIWESLSNLHNHILPP